MAYLLGVAAIVVGVPLSIALHEIGHLVPAKRFGIKCTQYMVGFGPTVWSRRVGETEYGVKAIPMGGYVRMIGMYPPQAPGAGIGNGRWAATIEAARAEARAEVGPDDEGRQFYQRPIWQRVIVMLGGPTMNLLLAVLLIGGVLVAYGVDQQTTTVGTVSKCVLPLNAPETATCSATDRPAPAAAAGLLPGDRIVSFAGRPIGEWPQVRDLIRANAGTAVPLVVERDGRQVALSITPIRDQRAVLDADGRPVKGSDGQWLTEPTGFAGISPLIAPVPLPVTEVPGYLAESVGTAVSTVATFPGKIVGVARAVVGLQERDPESPMSVVGVGRLAGEVAAGDVGSTHVPVAARVAMLIGLLGSLNLALFVLNLVPLLPLDGGHVAGAVWEGIRRTAARVLRRPDPGPVDTVRALPLIYAVGSVLLAVGVLLIVADVVSPVRLASG